MDVFRGTPPARGPVDPPCCSTSTSRPGPRFGSARHASHHRGRQCMPAQHKQHSPIASASISQRTPGIAADVAPPGSSANGQRMVTISYEEDTEDDVFIPAPPGGKTLKINVDLMLWRCRQARLKAQLSLNDEERRELLKEAEAGLRRCLVLDPSDARTYVVLGKLYMVQKRFDEARALYAQGVASTGNMNAYIWSAWGWLEFKTGNVARARQLFDAATVVDSTHACAWHKWGLLEKSQGNYLRARDLWRRGIERCARKPQRSNAYLYNALAVMAAELKRVSEARQWFEEGTSTVEGAASVALWQAWAVLEATQGEPQDVRHLFTQALRANPRSRYVHLAWGLWERECGNLRTCVELLERGLKYNPTDAALYQARALIEWRDYNRPDTAREMFQAGVKADPGHLPVWQAWGCMEAALGNTAQARELFQQGVWADPRNRDTVYVLHAWGCLERNQGNLQLARELFKAAVKVDPKAEKVWFTWIAMEADAGLLERADELRIQQAEQQWEFEVPAGFTTRPSNVPGAAAALSGPLGALRDTLSRFFMARNDTRAPGPPGRPVAPSQPLTTHREQGAINMDTLRAFIPSDFTGELSLDEMMALSASGTNTQPPQTQSQPQAPNAATSQAANHPHTPSPAEVQGASPPISQQQPPQIAPSPAVLLSTSQPPQPSQPASQPAQSLSESQPEQQPEPGVGLTEEQQQQLLIQASAMMTAFNTRPQTPHQPDSGSEDDTVTADTSATEQQGAGHVSAQSHGPTQGRPSADTTSSSKVPASDSSAAEYDSSGASTSQLKPRPVWQTPVAPVHHS